MKKPTWDDIGKIAVCAILFICVFRIIEWGVQLALGSGLDSGWAQAIGAVFAIFASGAIATHQGRTQFRQALELDQRSRSEAEVRIVAAIAEMITIENRRIYLLIQKFNSDRETLHALADAPWKFDSAAMSDIRAELGSIPLHDIPNTSVIGEIVMLRSHARQLETNIIRAMHEHRQMNGAAFSNFFNMLDKAHRDMCFSESLIFRELKRVKSSF